MTYDDFQNALEFLIRKSGKSKRELAVEAGLNEKALNKVSCREFKFSLFNGLNALDAVGSCMIIDGEEVRGYDKVIDILRDKAKKVGIPQIEEISGVDASVVRSWISGKHLPTLVCLLPVLDAAGAVVTIKGVETVDYNKAFDLMPDAAQEAMWDLYMKGVNHDGHSWVKYKDVQDCVAKIVFSIAEVDDRK